MPDRQRYSGATGQSETTMRDLLAVVFRRKWLILGIFGVATLLVGVKEFSSPTSWSADATLLLNRQNARASVLERSGRVLPWTEVIESEIEVVRSSNREFVFGEEVGGQPTPDAQKEIEHGRGKLADEVLLAAQARTTDLGIEILDFRFKRLNYVEAVRQEVYARMIS